ncbi:MAG: Homeodomain-like domain [Solirubrobacteraceae bacterium]|nr:Homeodomain-like domain [Solirubrobacteraceae bacterium]
MQRQVLVDLLAAGLSIDAIARRVQRSPSTVSYWLKRHDLQANGAAKYSADRPLEAEELAGLVANGLSVPQIALAVSRSTGRRAPRTGAPRPGDQEQPQPA